MKKQSDKKIILHLTQQQVDLIMAVIHGYIVADFGETYEEYSHWECYSDLKNMLAKKGIYY